MHHAPWIFLITGVCSISRAVLCRQLGLPSTVAEVCRFSSAGPDIETPCLPGCLQFENAAVRTCMGMSIQHKAYIGLHEGKGRPISPSKRSVGGDLNTLGLGLQRIYERCLACRGCALLCCQGCGCFLLSGPPCPAPWMIWQVGFVREQPRL